jgi:hypothetical protein
MVLSRERGVDALLRELMDVMRDHVIAPDGCPLMTAS